MFHVFFTKCGILFVLLNASLELKIKKRGDSSRDGEQDGDRLREEREREKERERERERGECRLAPQSLSAVCRKVATN